MAAPKITILGLAGVDGSAGMGKDTLAAKYLRSYGFMPVAFADEIKMRCVRAGRCTFEEAFITKPDWVRQLLQEEGTERGRKVYGENYWLDQLKLSMTQYQFRWGMDRFVVTDPRFPNEIDWIQEEQGGHVIGIDAPKRYAANGMSEKNRAHASERAMDGLSHMYHAIVKNDPEFEPVVGLQLRGILASFGVISTDPDVRLGVTTPTPLPSYWPVHVGGHPFPGEVKPTFPCHVPTTSAGAPCE